MTKKKVAAQRNSTQPLRIYISYSINDGEPVLAIKNSLSSEGHKVIQDSANVRLGDNVPELVSKFIEDADALIVVISNNSLRSDWAQREFSAIALQQISKGQQRVIPVKLDNCEVPSYFADRLFIDFSQDFERGLSQLMQVFRIASPEALEKSHPKTPASEFRGAHITKLKDYLRRGRLTLFCGAGVSVGAGIPNWDELLIRLLDSMMERLSKDHSLEIGKKSAIEFQSRNKSSSLILGKYLKNNLGKDFTKEVRAALYSGNPEKSEVIDSILDLSRPQRDGKALDSIVTFNFDCLIEDNLLENSIPNKAIFSEAINHDSNEMPIYHVHGYLPRVGEIADDIELVFSEDAYHSQFIDPFSWSNLIQLNKLTQNTCLFVGISLTDPNMRRLLDVAWRKNPEKRLRHYIVKKLPRSAENTDVLDEVSRLLEEQDANALGLNVIWMSNFSELPQILSEIAQPGLN